MQHDEFRSGAVDTSYLEKNPHLFEYNDPGNRTGKLLGYLGTLMVNGPLQPGATGRKPANVRPTVPKIGK